MNDQNEITHAEEVLLDAIRNGDIEQLDDLLHKDLLFNLQDGTTITKEADMQIYRSGALKVTGLEASGRQISLIGDTAVVTQRIALEGVYSDQGFSGNFAYLRVWKRSGGNWQVIAGSCHAV